MIKLKAKQKKFLKKLVNENTPTIQIGKDGLKEEIIKHINDVLDYNELVRIKILDVDLYPLKETAEKLSNLTCSIIIKIIGKKVIIYKKSKILEKEKRIIFPD